MSSKNSIKVYARIRPPVEESNPLEVAVVDDSTVLVAVKTENSVSKHEIDQVFQHDATQEDLFEEIGKRSINSMLKGYSVSLLAYGATGSCNMLHLQLSSRIITHENFSGKTHSLWGESLQKTASWGLIPRVVTDILQRFKDSDRFTKTSVHVNYLQDYKNNLEDLLNNKKQVSIRNNQPYGAVSKRIQSSKDLMNVLEMGTKHRAVASHEMNENSSRSHAIFAIKAEFYDVQEDAACSGTIFLFDLAGAERAGQMSVEGDMMKESQYINKSLLSLAQVMTALAHNSKVKRRKRGKEKFVPFRNTMLTQVLKSAITGETLTSILLTLSATSKMQQDLLARSVMEFGETARQLKIKPKKNKKVVSKQKLKKNARKLHSENSAFKKEQGKQALEAKEKLKKRMALMGVKDKEEEEKERKAKELAQKRQALLSSFQAFQSYLPSVQNDEILSHSIIDRDDNAKSVKSSILDLVNAQQDWISQTNPNADDLTLEQMDSLIEEAKNRFDTLQAEVNPHLDKLQELIDAEKQAVDQAKQSLAISIRNTMQELMQIQVFDAEKKPELDQLIQEATQQCSQFEQNLSANTDTEQTLEDFSAKKQEFLDTLQPTLDRLHAQVESEKNTTETEINKLKSYLNNIRGAISDIGDKEDQQSAKQELQSVYDNAKSLLDSKTGEDSPASRQDSAQYTTILNDLQEKVNPIFAQMDQTDLERKNARNSIHSLLDQSKDKLQSQYHPEEDDTEMRQLIDDANKLIEGQEAWIDNHPEESIEEYNSKLSSLQTQFGDLFDKLNEKKAQQEEKASQAKEKLQLYIDSKKENLNRFAPRDLDVQEEKEKAASYVEGYSNWLNDNPKEQASVYHTKHHELEEAVEPIETLLKENKKKEKEELDHATQDINNYLASVQKIFDEKKDRLSDDQKEQVQDAIAKLSEWLSNDEDKTPQDLKDKLQQMKQMLDSLVEHMLTEEVESESEDDVDDITRDINESEDEQSEEENSTYKDKEMLNDIFSTEIAELKRKFEGLPATLPEITHLCIIFPPNKKYFMDLGGLEKIIPYMDPQNEHHGHCVIAASALSQIADFPEARQRARELSACSLLRNVLTLVSSNQAHSQVAARATEQLAEGSEENALLLQEHLLDPFIAQFKETQNQNTLQYICSALSKLSEFNNTVQDALIRLDAMDKVSKLTFYDSQAMREAALDMIMVLAQSSPEFRKAFTENNGFETIKNAFIWAREKKDESGNVTRAEDTSILKKCGGCLFYLIQDESFRAIYEEWQYSALLRGHILHYLASVGNFSVNASEPEMVTANDDGDPFEYTGSSYYGEMKGLRLGGGMSHQTFRENYQYMLSVDHEEDSSICFCLRDKTETSNLRKNNPVYIGFHLVHNQESLDDYHQIDIADSVYKERRGAGHGENYWVIRNLPKGVYRLIVYATRKDQLTQYALSMYSSHPEVSLDPVVNDAWLRQIYDAKVRRSSSDSTVGSTEKSLYWRQDPQYVITAEEDIQLTISGGYATLNDQPGKIPMVLRLLSAEKEGSKMRVMDLAGSSRARSYTHTQVTVDLKKGESQHVQLSLDTTDTDMEARLRLITYAMGAYRVEPVQEWNMLRIDNASGDWPERVEFEVIRENVAAAAEDCGEMEVALSLEWEAESDESSPEVSFEVEDSEAIQEIPLGYLKDTDKTMNITHLLTEKKHKISMVRSSEEYKNTKFHLRICAQEPISLNLLTPTVEEASEEKLIHADNKSSFEPYLPKELGPDDLMEPLLSDQAKAANSFELTAEEQLLSNRINSLQKELQDALLDNAQVASLRRKVDEQASQIKRLHNEVESLQKQLKEAQSNLLVAQSASNEGESTDEEKQKLLDIITGLKKDIGKANANANMIQVKAQKEINEMKTKVDASDKMEQKIRDLEKDLQETKEALQKADSQQKESDSSEREKWEQEVSSLKQKIADQASELKEKSSNSNVQKETNAELETSKKQVEELKKALEEANSKIHALQEELRNKATGEPSQPSELSFTKSNLEEQGIVFSPRGEHIVGTKSSEEKLQQLNKESKQHQEEADRLRQMMEEQKKSMTEASTPASKENTSSSATPQVHTTVTDGGKSNNGKSSTCVVS